MNCAICQIELYQTSQGWFHNTSLKVNHEAALQPPSPPVFRSRHDIRKRRTAAWEALGLIRKHYPWRLIPTIPLGKQ